MVTVLKYKQNMREIDEETAEKTVDEDLLNLLERGQICTNQGCGIEIRSNILVKSESVENVLPQNKT